MNLTIPLFFSLVCLADDDFKLVKKEQSIALYERWVEHNGETVRELKAVFRAAPATLESFTNLLRDSEKGVAWNANAKMYKVLPGATPHSWQVYLQYEMPWPFKDLDGLLSYRLRKDPGNSGLTEIVFQSAESSNYPVPTGFNRITGTEGKWIIREQEAGLEITYLIKTDRSNHVPRWITDPIVHENLFKTMHQFKSLLEDR